MEKILSLVRRCAEDYEMLAPGDRVAVGVSGGKDSLVLLLALARLRTFYPIPFTVEAVTLDLGGGADYAPIAALCQREGIPYTSTLFSTCAGKKIPAPCARKCAAGPYTPPCKSGG